MARRVRNAVNTTGDRCDCYPRHGSHHHHYYDVSGSTRQVCATIDCGRTDVMGGHILLASAVVYEELIAPICYACNAIPSDEVYEIDERVALVHAERPEIKRVRTRKSEPVTTGLPFGQAAVTGTAVVGGLIVVGALLDHFTRPKVPAQPATPPTVRALQLEMMPWSFENVRSPAGV